MSSSQDHFWDGSNFRNHIVQPCCFIDEEPDAQKVKGEEPDAQKVKAWSEPCLWKSQKAALRGTNTSIWGSPPSSMTYFKDVLLAAEGLGVVPVVDFRFFNCETFVYFSYNHDLKSVSSPLRDQWWGWAGL